MTVRPYVIYAAVKCPQCKDVVRGYYGMPKCTTCFVEFDWKEAIG